MVADEITSWQIGGGNGSKDEEMQQQPSLGPTTILVVIAAKIKVEAVVEVAAMLAAAATATVAMVAMVATAAAAATGMVVPTIQMLGSAALMFDLKRCCFSGGRRW
eukprot:9809602-Ditylum_brightwellii.AAC.1